MDSSVLEVEKHVLDKVYGRTRPQRIIGVDSVLNSVEELLQSTVALRKGDSCLVIGPHGCGKTLVVERCLENLARDRPGEFLVVRLSGLALSDDKMAIREVSRQLDLEISHYEASTTALESELSAETFEMIEKQSLSATMQSILKLFDDAEYAQAEREQREQEEEDEMYGGGDLSPKPHRLGEIPHSAATTPKPELPKRHVSVLFVVDGLERFATVGKQTLLYNLLDLSQSSPLGVAVVGLTSRVSAGEALEKRVRSRFSQRYYCVPRPQTLDEFRQVCHAMLCVDSPELEKRAKSVVEAYHNHLANALADESHPVGRASAAAFYTSNDPRVFAAQVAPLLPLVTRRDPESQELARAAVAVCAPSTALGQIEGLSELQQAVLISTARAQQRFNTAAVNLVLVQDEYHSAITSLRRERSGALAALVSFREWSPKAVREAWERLRDTELVVAVGGDAANQQPADLRMYRCALLLAELRATLDPENPLYELTKL